MFKAGIFYQIFTLLYFKYLHNIHPYRSAVFFGLHDIFGWQMFCVAFKEKLNAIK